MAWLSTGGTRASRSSKSLLVQDEPLEPHAVAAVGPSEDEAGDNRRAFFNARSVTMRGVGRAPEEVD